MQRQSRRPIPDVISGRHDVHISDGVQILNGPFERSEEFSEGSSSREGTQYTMMPFRKVLIG